MEVGEIHGHHMEVKLLLKIEQMIDKVLDDYSSPPPMYLSFIAFSTSFDEW